MPLKDNEARLEWQRQYYLDHKEERLAYAGIVRAEDKVAKLEAEITQLGRLADQWDSSHEQACADFGVVHITQEPAHVTQPLPRNKMPWETNE